MKDENMQDILNQVKHVDTGINNMLIPILQDTIRDGNRHNKRMFISYITIIVILSMLLGLSIFYIYKQNIKYQEFLSQFDFETTETVYQDLNSGDGDIVNAHLENNKQR